MIKSIIDALCMLIFSCIFAFFAIFVIDGWIADSQRQTEAVVKEHLALNKESEQ